VRLLKTKDEACCELETIMMDIKHMHARHHSQSSAFAPTLIFDSDSVFEAPVTRQMCARLGIGVQFSARYAHRMRGKAERPWRTLRVNAFAMLHSMAVPNSMWSCVVNAVVYLRNRTDSRSVGLTGGIPLTLLTSSAHDASKFRVFGCAVFAKVPDKLHRKLGEKAFRGVMVGYPTDAPGYRVHNPETRRITTSVHVVFQENTPGFGTRLPIDSFITDPSDDDSPLDTSPPSHRIDTPLSDPTASRQARLRSHPLRFGDLVPHMSEYPPTLVTACCDPDQGKAKEDIFEQPHTPDVITGTPHTPAGTSPTAVALLSARECVEPKSYLAALDSAHAPQWQAAMT
jgi:hypothetical protein